LRLAAPAPITFWRAASFQILPLILLSGRREGKLQHFTFRLQFQRQDRTRAEVGAKTADDPRFVGGSVKQCVVWQTIG
jgi:hypothetical protein